MTGEVQQEWMWGDCVGPGVAMRVGATGGKRRVVVSAGSRVREING